MTTTIVPHRQDQQDQQDRYCLAQHSGTWGPWYHVSGYRRTAKGGWVRVWRDGQHLNRRQAAALLAEDPEIYRSPDALRRDAR